ncbi:hypothetical protein GCM10027074_42640 [Streptomyces deserti]
MSGTEWPWQDQASSPAHGQLVTASDETPQQAALRRLGEHCASCPTCRAVDETGANAHLPCEEADQLSEELRQARRGPTASFPERGKLRLRPPSPARRCR